MKKENSLKLFEQKCPICNNSLYIYPGYKNDKNDKPFVFCSDCDYEREPTDKELLKLLGFD